MQIKENLAKSDMRRILAILLLMAPLVQAELLITEVMYNPPGEDNNKEYVELFSDEIINLSEYTFEDFSAQDNLTLVQQSNSSYYLVVEDRFNATGINATIYNAGSSIGNNLNNDGDLAMFRHGFRAIDLVLYSHTSGGDGDGKSLCRSGNVFQNRLYACEPTPGLQNLETNQTPANTTPVNTSQQPNYDFQGLRINEVLPDPVGNDNAALPLGEWVELYNGGNAEIDAAGLKIKDKSDNAVTISSANVIESTMMQPQGYLVVYMNGNSMFNNNGFEQVRLFYNMLAVDEMSYVDSKRGLSWSRFDEVFKITNATPGTENVLYEAIEEKDDTEKKQRREQDVPQESSVRITDVQPASNASFGDVLKVKVQIYRGATRKSSVQVGIEKVGRPILLQFYNRFSNYTLQLPIAVLDNCDGKMQDGEYSLYVKGFGIEDRVPIKLKDGRCATSVYKPVTQGLREADRESFINYKETDTSTVAYTSPQARIEESIVYIFWAAVAIVAVYVVIAHERKNKGKVHN